MGNFNYEWWTVRVHEATGWVTWEIKAKSRDNAIRQIRKEIAKGESEENKTRPCWKRKPVVLGVDWDTLTLDRVGYQRLS